MDNLAKVPLPKPGFAALNLAAPVILNLNAQGAKYKESPPKNLDEEKIRAVVQHIVNSKAMASTSSKQTYCSQCAMENRRLGVGTPAGTPNFIPVIMMPIYSADQCPFKISDCDMDADKKVQKKRAKPDAVQAEKVKADIDDDDSVMRLRQQYSLERFSDFDLLSQW